MSKKNNEPDSRDYLNFFNLDLPLEEDGDDDDYNFVEDILTNPYDYDEDYYLSIPNIESTAIPNNNQIEDEHEEINSDNEMNNNNNNNDINCYVIDNNISIPLLSDYTIHQFDNDELSLYTDITVFLKNEYTKIEEAKAKANEAMDLLLKIGSKMMEENEKYIQENKIPDGPLVGKRKSHD